MSAQIFTLPDLGEGLTEAELIRWLVAVGDPVAVDEPVAEVETAKATVEVPSPFAGTVATLHGEEGTMLVVGAPLISVDDGAAPDGATATYVEEERAGSGNVLVGYGTSAVVPTRRRRAPAGRTTRNEAPTSTSPAVVPAAPSVTGSRPVVSPIVRQLARRGGVDLATLVGTGPNGLITRRDVETAAAARAEALRTEQTRTEPTRTERGAVTEPGPRPAVDPCAGADLDRRTGLAIRGRVPIRGVRKAATETLTRSRAEIPEATTWVDVDATALLELRANLAEHSEAPGILAMVARFTVAGLARFPTLNARVDTGRGEIAHLDGVNLGIAAQTGRGLVVPVVRDAHRLGMRALDAEIRRLTVAAREGTATTAELSSGSFTLNNYGPLGVDGSAAIINHPEVAILGMGRILPRPWVVAGEVVPRRIVQLSLVFDHRVCDGGDAGGFLRFVADAIEAPVAAMADL